MLKGIVGAGRSGLREAGADWLLGGRGEPESGSKAGVESRGPEDLQDMEKQDTDAEAAQQLPLEAPGSIPSVGWGQGLVTEGYPLALQHFSGLWAGDLRGYQWPEGRTLGTALGSAEETGSPSGSESG